MTPTRWSNLISCVKLRKSPLEALRADIQGTVGCEVGNASKMAHHRGGSTESVALQEASVSAQSEAGERTGTEMGAREEAWWPGDVAHCIAPSLCE